MLVIRQKTTRTSGYHTNHGTMRQILLEGVNIAEQAAVKQVIKKKDCGKHELILDFCGIMGFNELLLLETVHCMY